MIIFYGSWGQFGVILQPLFPCGEFLGWDFCEVNGGWCGFKLVAQSDELFSDCFDFV